MELLDGVPADDTGERFIDEDGWREEGEGGTKVADENPDDGLEAGDDSGGTDGATLFAEELGPVLVLEVMPEGVGLGVVATGNCDVGPELVFPTEVEGLQLLVSLNNVTHIRPTHGLGPFGKVTTTVDVPPDTLNVLVKTTGGGPIGEDSCVWLVELSNEEVLMPGGMLVLALEETPKVVDKLAGGPRG